jgi:hypothetical protein
LNYPAVDQAERILTGLIWLDLKDVQHRATNHISMLWGGKLLNPVFLSPVLVQASRAPANRDAPLQGLTVV